MLNNDAVICRFPAGDPALRTGIGKKTADGMIRLDGEPGVGVFGPYVDLEAGGCTARVLFDGSSKGRARVELCTEAGALVVASRTLDLAALAGGAAELRTVLQAPLTMCEVRLFCERGVHATISAVEIRAGGCDGCAPGVKLDAYLRYFAHRIAPLVEGWVGGHLPLLMRVIAPAFAERSIAGHIAEIGVHHGLSLFLFTALRRGDERCFAIDVFDDQSLNIDHSGSGSLAIFRSHLATLLPLQQPFVEVVQRDSLAFSVREFTDLFAPRGIKLFSVDGGHTVAHVCNDLALAQEVLVPGGIVALDDFFGPHWPGVTEGFYHFMATRNRRLRPLLFFQNKLFLTTISEHDWWQERLWAGLVAELGEDDMRGGGWKYVDISGVRVLSRA